jgi:hypothetical protein
MDRHVDDIYSTQAPRSLRTVKGEQHLPPALTQSPLTQPGQGLGTVTSALIMLKGVVCRFTIFLPTLP